MITTSKLDCRYLIYTYSNYCYKLQIYQKSKSNNQIIIYLINNFCKQLQNRKRKMIVQVVKKRLFYKFICNKCNKKFQILLHLNIIQQLINTLIQQNMYQNPPNMYPGDQQTMNYMYNDPNNMQNAPNQIYPPQNFVPNPQVDTVIATGFGDMFFNMNDPRIAQTNVPIKQDSSNHTSTIVGTIILIGGVVAGGVGFNTFLLPNQYVTGIIIGISYLIYLITCICISDIRGYITNLKKFDQYKAIYDSMVVAKGFFRFWIQCYHYRTVRTKNGTRRQKVVTHTATQRYNPALSEDVSGNITGIQDITKYVFVNYLKKFYFSTPQSQTAFNNAFNAFVAANRRDQYQNYTRTFDIDGFQEEVGFCALGEGSHNSCVFYLTAFLGVSLIYSCILQRSVSRYSINIVKKLTCT